MDWLSTSFPRIRPQGAHKEYLKVGCPSTWMLLNWNRKQTSNNHQHQHNEEKMKEEISSKEEYQKRIYPLQRQGWEASYKDRGPINQTPL